MRTFLILAVTALLATGFTGRLPAQLAITEVMAESSTNGLPSFQGPDYWELTNFGDNDINLDGYGFSDDRVTTVFSGAFANLTIRAGESIIFCRSNGSAPFITSVEEFKDWWGGNRLPADLQVRFYNLPGLSGDGDQLWLRNPSGGVVDMVKIGPSVHGRSMTYDLETGTFGISSEPGVNGAFRSAKVASDIGSPGRTPGRASSDN